MQMLNHIAIKQLYKRKYFVINLTPYILCATAKFPVLIIDLTD